MGDATLNISVVSYGAAALAFALLTGLLIYGWRGKFQGALLATAACITGAWAGLSAYASATNGALSALADLLEIARDGLWLLFLWKLLAASVQTENKRIQQRMARWLVLGTLLFGAIFVTALALYFELLPAHPQIKYITLMVGRALLAVLGLALVEQLYRNALTSQRWAIKYLCLGLGVLFAYDFYFYSDAMLFRMADADIWTARGFINALVVPLIAVAAARNPLWSLDVHVSRRVVFHSAAVIGAGAYLLIMAGAGYYIRLFGGSWGGVLQVAFLVGAAIMLLAAIFSGALRARLKVFLSKHFFNYKYDYREEWLRFTHTLSAGEPGLTLRHRSLQAVAELVDSPAAALWVEEGGVFCQAAQWNWPATPDTEAEQGSLCQFLTERQWVINLKEYLQAPDIYGALQVPTWLLTMPRAWLITPLVLHERLMGFIVLAESRSPRDFNWEDSDLLKTAGRQVAVYLAQIQATEALVEARQFESFNRLSTYVVHDLKNIVAQLTLLLANAQKHKDNPAFQEDMLATVDNAAQRMTRLLAQLRTGYQSAQQASGVDLAALLAHLVKEKTHGRPVPQLQAPTQPVWVVADKERLSRVVGHLIQNAIEATPPTGVVNITLEAHGDFARITVQDSGQGMDEEFMRERLFRPFETTKSGGMGIGAYECREYVRILRGEIVVTSHKDMGTTFRVSLPQCKSMTRDAEQSPMQGATGA